MSIGGTNPQPGLSTGEAKNGVSSGEISARSAPRRTSSRSGSGGLGTGPGARPAAGPANPRKLNGRANVTFRTTIPSTNAASQEVQKRILDGVEKCGFTPHSVFAIKLALEEAMINAIKHGNRLDPKKNVHVRASVTPKQAEITIEDEGPGFNRADVPDPTLEENREKCSGRGILLIESYMNTVEWSHNGRRLRMIKRNGEEPGVR